MTPEAVLFDLDGVLINSNFDDFRWAYDVRKEEIQKRSENIHLRDYQQLIFDVDSRKELENLMDEKHLCWEDVREIERAVVKEKKEMVESGEIGIFEDVKPVMDSINQPKAVVSNAYQDFLDFLSAETYLGNIIDYWKAPSLSNLRNYHSEMKPAPYMAREAIETLNAEQAVMVGDSEADIRAAKRTGIKSIYIDRKGGKHRDADKNIENLFGLKDIID